MWRHGGFLFIRMLDNASKGDLLRNAKHVERKRVARVRTRQSTESTNVYHKAQYINAFVEAQSVRLSRAMREEKEAGVEQSLLAVIHTNRPPALLTQPQEQLSSSSSLLSLLKKSPTEEEGEERKDISLLRSSSSLSSQKVLFGAWREGSPAVERACLLMDRNKHRIMRGATTPAVFSPESLQRCVPMRLARVNQLLDFFNRNNNNNKKAKKHNGKTLMRWREQDVSVFAAEMFACMRDICNGDVKREEKWMAFILQRAVEWDWAWAIQLYSKHILPYLKEQINNNNNNNNNNNMNNNMNSNNSGSSMMEAISASISTQLAVLCETIRFHYMFLNNESTTSAGPTFQQVSQLIEITTTTTTSLLLLPLLPVAAAPLFSILRPDGNNTWRDVLTFIKYFQSQQGHQRLSYLPSIAWAELLRAVHRMGATQTEIQSLVDIITDPHRTKQADKLMRDTNVWNAYLAVSDWPHALDVFSNNLKHYGVKETAATSAALMESLLRDKQWEKALEIFHDLQKKEGSLIMIGTSGVFTAVFNALAQKGDWHALTSQLIDFDHFLIHFGVPHTWWENSPLRRKGEKKNNNNNYDDDDELFSEEEFQAWMLFAGELLNCSCATPELVKAIQTALVVCDPRRKEKKQQQQQQEEQEKRREREEITSEDMITAESLHDLL